MGSHYKNWKWHYVPDDERIEVAALEVGHATAHDAAIVHGVSRIKAGARYNLYAIWALP